MWVIETSLGTFVIHIYPHMNPPDHGDGDGAAVQFGANFEVDFTPKSTHNVKIGLIQLIRPLTDVGSYRQNKTTSGWAIDKNRDTATNASNYAYKLTFGITDDNARPDLNSRFGLNGTPAITRDIPTEILSVQSEKIGRQNTKFVHYVTSPRSNTIHDEGVIWSYCPVGADSNATTEVSAPQLTRLSKQKEHREAMAHFLGVSEDVISKMIVK
jgi:hypothetical protein